MSGIAGVPGGLLGSVGGVLRDSFPGVSATLRGTGEDVSTALSKGQYAKAAGVLGRNTLGMLPMAAADDIVGGFVRGAYNTLRNPAEDFGRGVLGMEDRPAPSAPDPAPDPDVQPNPTDQRLAAGTQRSPLGGPAAQPGQLGQPGETVDDSRTLRRQDRPGQSPLFTNVPDGGMLGNDNLMNRGQVSAQNMAAADAMDAQQHQESVGRLRQAQYASEVQRAQTLNQGEALRQSEAKRAQLMDQLQSGKIGARKSARLALATMDSDTQNANQRRATDLNYDATLRGHDVSLRGQDVQMFGHRATTANNRAKLLYDMSKDQRDYNLNVEKFGVEKSSNALKQREASDKAMREQILGQLPMVKDANGKMVPDEQGATQYMRSAYARMDQRQNELMKELQANPKNKEAQAELESLQHYGLGALSADPQAKNEFLVGMQARGAARENASWWNPMSADRAAGASSQPITSLKWDPDSLFDGYRDQNNNWIPEHVIDQGGSWFGARTGKYDTLKRKD